MNRCQKSISIFIYMATISHDGVMEADTWCGRMRCWANDSAFAAELKKCKTFEQDIVRNTLADIVCKSTCILDVGAHVGMHTLGYVQMNEIVQVHAFEPQSRMFELLQRNVASSSAADRVHLYNVAVGHRSGEVQMSASVADGPNANKPIAYGTHDVYNMGGLAVGSGGEKANMIELDSLGLEACDFIKIDVEGLEPLVLFGAKELICKHRPTIMFESNHKRITDAAKSTLGDLNLLPTLDAFEILKDFGYQHIDKVSSDNYMAKFKSN